MYTQRSRARPRARYVRVHTGVHIAVLGREGAVRVGRDQAAAGDGVEAHSCVPELPAPRA